MTGRWSSPGISVSSTNKTDHHDITEILLKVALSRNNTHKFVTFSRSYTTSSPKCFNSIHDEIVSVVASSVIYQLFEPGLVKPRTIKLVFDIHNIKE
jgi:hypothetical protein